MTWVLFPTMTILYIGHGTSLNSTPFQRTLAHFALNQLIVPVLALHLWVSLIRTLDSSLLPPPCDAPHSRKYGNGQLEKLIQISRQSFIARTVLQYQPLQIQ